MARYENWSVRAGHASGTHSGQHAIRDRTHKLIQVISSTTREGRFSEKVASWVIQHLEAREDFEIELVDLRDHPLPFFDGVAPARAPREYASAEVERLGRTLDRADGFIVATAEYNHGYPAVHASSCSPTT